MCTSRRVSSGSRFLSGESSCSEAGSLSRSYRISSRASAEIYPPRSSRAHIQINFLRTGQRQ